MEDEKILIVHTQVYFFVIFFNVGIACINFFLVWRFCVFRNFLARLTITLKELEAYSFIVLQNTPQILRETQEQIYNLRTQRQEIEIKLENIRKIFVIIGLIIGFWQKRVAQRAVPSGSPRKKKTRSTQKFYNRIT